LGWMPRRGVAPEGTCEATDVRGERGAGSAPRERRAPAEIPEQEHHVVAAGVVVVAEVEAAALRIAPRDVEDVGPGLVDEASASPS